MRKRLEFQSIQEWQEALMKLNRQEIVLLNQGDIMGMEVFEPNKQFRKEWSEHYGPKMTLGHFRQITQGGWYYLSSALAGYRSDIDRFHLMDNGFDPLRHDDNLKNDEQVERELANISSGRKIVLARVVRNWPHEPFRVCQVTQIPESGKLSIVFRGGRFILKEKDSKFKIQLGTAGSSLSTLRAANFVDTTHHGPLWVGCRLHHFNAAPILDWIFLSERDGVFEGRDVLADALGFFTEHPSGSSRDQVQELVELTWISSNRYYFTDWRD